ncbi:MAG: hypothetical protein WAM28_00495 [Chlamydiales bacterium]
MKIKINEKLICIPPHISARWDQIAFLQTSEDSEKKNLTLIIHLIDGKVIQIPDLDVSLVDIIFSAHIKYLESSGQKGNEPPKTLGDFIQQLGDMSPKQLMGMPIRFGINPLAGGLEGIEMAFQHNPSQGDSPDMPKEFLEKISSIAKMFGGGDPAAFPKPEPHCNCMHCQIARAIHGAEKEEVSDGHQEETVTKEDLYFPEWNITQSGDKLFTVTNPLDPKEHYSVYLGSPVGCTCGQDHCEHIEAVLYS